MIILIVGSLTVFGCTVAPINEKPAVFAGNDKAVTVGDVVNLEGIVSDDGLPLDEELTISWSKVSGPNNYNIKELDNPISSVIFQEEGIYILRLTVNDGELQDSDDVVITVSEGTTNIFQTDTWIEAEDGDISGRLEKRTESGITFVYLPTASSGGYDGEVSYVFDVKEASEYKLETKIFSADASSNSFFVGTENDDAQGNKIFDSEVSTDYIIDEVNWRDEQDPTIWNLSTGKHKFIFYGREPLTKLDKIRLTKLEDVQCDVGDWTNAGCGQGNCNENQMRQTRTATPAGCESLTSRCVADSNNCIIETCFDKKQNQGEQGVDCGGPCAKSCDENLLGIHELKEKAINFYTGQGKGTSDPYVSKTLSSIKYNGQKSMDTMNSDGSWPDIIDYDTQKSAGSTLTSHFKRINNMAQAYKTPGQSLHRNSQLLSAINKALLYIKHMDSVNDCVYPYTDCPWGGWIMSIGVPRELSYTLLLVGDDISQSAYDITKDTLDSHMRPLSTGSRSNYNFDTAFISMQIALATQDKDLMKKVQTTMNNVIIPNALFGEGIYVGVEGLKPDYSYLDHGPALYTGAYGADYGKVLSEFAYLTAGSIYAINENSMKYLANYYAESTLWAINDEYFDPAVKGRSATRYLDLTSKAKAALILMANTPSTKNSQIVQATKKYIDAYKGSYVLSAAGLVSEVVARSEQAMWPSGNKYYPFADFAVHRRPGFYLSIKQHSDRTLTGEKVSNENLKGALVVDGKMLVTLKGDEYAGDVLQTLDWSRLPGITVQQKPDVELLPSLKSGNEWGLSSGFGWPGLKSFVGGTSNGQNGVAVMDMNPRFTPELTAKKAWFFFEDYVVFITKNIKDNSGYVVETIVDQRPISSDMYVDGNIQPNNMGWSSILSNPTWITDSGVGYYFPTSSTVKVKRETQSGKRKDINVPYGGEETVYTNMSTIWFDHGKNPNNAQAVYVVVPNKNHNSMSAWVSNNDLDIIKNDDEITALQDEDYGLLGAVFWQASTLNSIPGLPFTSISTDTPSVILVQKENSNIKVSVADPDHKSGTMRFTFNTQLTKVSADEGVVISTGNGKTYVDVPRNEPYGGWTHTFILS